MNAIVLRKPRQRRAVRLNITLDPTLHSTLQIIIRRHGFNGASDYFQSRIRFDGHLDTPASIR